MFITTELTPPPPRALSLWLQCTFCKGGINSCITQTSLSSRGHTGTQSILAPLFQPQGLGAHRILLHCIKANLCHLSYQNCLLPKQPFLMFLHSRYICLSVLQPKALLGERYSLSFIISLSQSQLFKPWSCRFVKVSGVKPQPSGFLYKYKEAWHVLLTLQNHSRDIHFQLLHVLALRAEPGEPRVLQSSPWLCQGILKGSSDCFSKEKAFVSEMLSLTSVPTKCFQTMGADVLKNQKYQEYQASPGVKDSPMGVLESMMGICPWGRTDLHFAMTHSLGLKTATEQRRCLAWYKAAHIQALSRICTEELIQHHPHLHGHSGWGGAAWPRPHCWMQKLIRCAHTWPWAGLHRSDVHISVCLHVGGLVSAPNGSKLCWQLQPAAKLCFCKLFILKSQKHSDQTTVSEQS